MIDFISMIFVKMVATLLIMLILFIVALLTLDSWKISHWDEKVFDLTMFFIMLPSSILSLIYLWTC